MSSVGRNDLQEANPGKPIRQDAFSGVQGRTERSKEGSQNQGEAGGEGSSLDDTAVASVPNGPEQREELNSVACLQEQQ